MGDTARCGHLHPEIYVDLHPRKNRRQRLNCQDPAVMEIWKRVFIQYNRDAALQTDDASRRNMWIRGMGPSIASVAPR